MYVMDDLLILVNTEKAKELPMDFGAPPAMRVGGKLHAIEEPLRSVQKN
jgi:Tfp pilus assembly ATPase PilU